MICFVSFSLSTKLIIILYKNIIQIDGKPDHIIIIYSKLLLFFFEFFFIVSHTREKTISFQLMNTTTVRQCNNHEENGYFFQIKYSLSKLIT